MHRLRDYLPLAASLLLALILGYCGGRIHSAMLKIPVSPFAIVADTRPTIPVVKIDDVHDGFIEGSLQGHVRLFGEGKMMVPDASGAFRIPLSVLRRTVAVEVPSGAQFVASKNGKKYYPVNSPAAARLKVETRRYFQTEAEAIAAGFKH